MLRLAGRSTSINVRKVIWTLGELGEPFELLDPSSDPEGARSLMSLNPIGLSPVLQDGEHLLWESNTVCRYLVGKCDRTDLLPENPRDRSEVEKWMDWQATNLNAAWVACFMALVRHEPTFVANPGAVQHSQERWNSLSLVLDAHLAHSDYLAVERFTLADIVIGLSVHRWRETPIQRPPTPHLDRYFARLRERPAMLVSLGRGEP